jgi:hypothetical protein
MDDQCVTLSTISSVDDKDVSFSTTNSVDVNRCIPFHLGTVFF